MTITVNPPTVHRTRRRGKTSDYAEQGADLYASGEAVTVTVDKFGPGWWVTGVDRHARMLTVYRDGGEMTVAWSEVSG